jgi:vacuolar-type H+-ATPase subunit E/Vma4
MGSKELIESLRAEAARRAETLLREATADAEKITEASKEKVRARRLEYERMLADCSDKESECLLREARGKADEAALRAWDALSGTLYRIARSMLPALRDRDYEEKSFQALSAELPPFKWEAIRVNPLDCELCARLFPGAAVVADASISGGIEAEALGGKIRAVNTFEKRFERLWTELMPLIVKDISREIENGKNP